MLQQLQQFFFSSLLNFSRPRLLHSLNIYKYSPVKSHNFLIYEYIIIHFILSPYNLFYLYLFSLHCTHLLFHSTNKIFHPFYFHLIFHYVSKFVQFFLLLCRLLSAQRNFLLFSRISGIQLLPCANLTIKKFSSTFLCLHSFETQLDPVFAISTVMLTND